MVEKHNLDKELIKIWYGLTDTVPLLRDGRVAKLETLAKKYLTTPEWKFQIHKADDALADCHLLEGFLRHLKIGEADLKKKAVSLEAFFENRTKLARKRSNFPLLHPLKGCV